MDNKILIPIAAFVAGVLTTYLITKKKNNVDVWEVGEKDVRWGKKGKLEKTSNRPSAYLELYKKGGQDENVVNTTNIGDYSFIEVVNIPNNVITGIAIDNKKGSVDAKSIKLT